MSYTIDHSETTAPAFRRTTTDDRLFQPPLPRLPWRSNLHRQRHVVFASKASPTKVKADLEARLLAYVGKPVEVIVRTAAQMAAVLKANPFPKAAPNRTVAIFLDEPPPPDALERAVGVKDEAMRLGPREIFVHYASGIGKSKLKIPIARRGSARNMSTIAKLADMAKNLQRSGPLITAPTKLSPTRDVLCCGAGVRSWHKADVVLAARIVAF